MRSNGKLSIDRNIATVIVTECTPSQEEIADCEMLNAELGDRRLVLTNYPLTASAAPFLAIPHFAIRNPQFPQ
jgi:hypothetical protein